MKYKTKAQKFVELFKYWCGKFGLKPDIAVIEDNRYHCRAAVIDYDTDKPKLIYNTKRLARSSDAFLVCSVFHEIGHLINNLPYDTEEEIIEAERQAEIFALKCLKKYYLNLYRDNIKETKHKMQQYYWRKQNPIYYQAFLKIKDYNE